MIDLTPLWGQAFLEGEARGANSLLTEARATYGVLAPAGAGEPFSYEVIVPEPPTLEWLSEKLLPKLVYHCETRRAPLPKCGAVFVSAFVGERLLCVPAAAWIQLATELLGVDWEELVERHGTGEVRHALGREDAAAGNCGGGGEIKGLLPGGKS